jgi:molybdate transport system substrate-binding protein
MVAATRIGGSMLRQFLLAAIVVLLPAAAAAEITVFAAASLKTAFDELVPLYEHASGEDVTVAFAGSSALARQIEAGAPADLFISANVGWMDELEAASLILPESRTDLLGNTLVLVAPDGEAPDLRIGPDMQLSAALGQGRLAMALVEAVPAGIYGRAALVSLHQWEAVAHRVAQADNVRAALALVATGAAPLGIVYATDAIADPRVSVVGAFPASSHPPIVYPAALLAEGRVEAAGAFLEWLSGPRAGEIFAAAGFTRPPDE